MAETVVMKDGRTIQGDVVEKTADYIKIESQGAQQTLYYKDIKRIGALSYIPMPQAAPSLSPSPAAPEPKEPVAVPSRVENLTDSVKTPLPPVQPKPQTQKGAGVPITMPFSFPGGGGDQAIIPSPEDFNRDGVNAVKWPDGKTMMEVPMKNGQISGPVKLYNPSGAPIGGIMYKDGQMVGTNLNPQAPK
jgi:hypothetical protein